jgi:PAS domain-containing protein
MLCAQISKLYTVKNRSFARFVTEVYIASIDMMESELRDNICAQQLADVLPVGVAIVNAHDEIVFANRRFHELTTSHQPIGLELIIVCVDRLREAVQSYWLVARCKLMKASVGEDNLVVRVDDVYNFEICAQSMLVLELMRARHSAISFPQ